MAHDPRREDYQRMALRFALTLDDDPTGAVRAMASFGRRLARDRDSLPQTDADRAFHLVTLAADLVDYQLPFADDHQAERLTARAEALLDEALSLDPACHDTVRMRTIAREGSAERRYRALADGADAVRASCEAERDRICAGLGDERRALAAEVAMRPWERWMAELAEDALICGRNRAAVEAAERLLEVDRHDVSDVRFTLAYALAKLEDEAGVARLIARYPSLCAPRAADDAWILLAQVALAHRRWDLAAARELLARLLRGYPGSGAALIRQTELPDGAFARLRVPPYGSDELILAVSEGTVLLQEGRESSGRGALGAWVARATAELDPQAARQAADAGGEARR